MYSVGDSIKIGSRYFVVVAFLADGRAVLRDDENETITRRI